MIDINKRIAKYRRFYEDKNPGIIMSNIWIAGSKDSEQENLLDYDFTKIEEHIRYWDKTIKKQLVAMNDREDIEDDWIPGIELYYGFGAFGSVFMDSKLIFTKETSHIEPVLKNWDDLEKLDFKKKRFWSSVFINAAEYINQKAAGRFMLDAFPQPSPLDLANLIRGNDIFTDFYEYPNELKKLLEMCTDAAIHNIKKIAAASRSSIEGVFIYNQWIPYGTFLLEDAADLCSPDIYMEFGFPYTQKVIDAVGGAYLHHHALGRQQYANMSKLKGLHVHQITKDPNCKNASEELEEVIAKANDVPLSIDFTADEVYSKIDIIRKGRIIVWASVDSKKDAADLTKFINCKSR